ncbi:phage holin family protein [Nocardioides sp. DS6]|uniref:Phage holin family protein n=1 Tax=Nocardioides eburneus TaxID=3231482 RepID=A0ABV3ST58_9ACTN
MRFLTWLLTNAVALAVALWLVPGIWLGGPTSGSEEIKHKLWRLIVVALILGIVNYLVKPVMKVLSIPFIILTLGLFLLVINAAMLGLTAWILSGTDVGFHVDGFWAAVLGGLIIAVVGAVVRRALEDER